jgi:hypothetical protein
MESPVDPLRKAWAVSPSPNPEFRPAVWTRIERTREPTSFAAWLRPRWAAVSLCGLTAIGLSTAVGAQLAALERRAAIEEQIEIYLASIDAHTRLSRSEVPR